MKKKNKFQEKSHGNFSNWGLKNSCYCFVKKKKNHWGKNQLFLSRLNIDKKTCHFQNVVLAQVAGFLSMTRYLPQALCSELVASRGFIADLSHMWVLPSRCLSSPVSLFTVESSRRKSSWRSCEVSVSVPKMFCPRFCVQSTIVFPCSCWRGSGRGNVRCFFSVVPVVQFCWYSHAHHKMWDPTLYFVVWGFVHGVKNQQGSLCAVIYVFFLISVFEMSFI